MMYIGYNKLYITENGIILDDELVFEVDDTRLDAYSGKTKLQKVIPIKENSLYRAKRLSDGQVALFLIEDEK